MPETKPVLSQFSDALSGLAAGARAFLATVRTGDAHLSGVLWTPNAVVVSEQALPDAAEYKIQVADAVATARLAGRDKGTNIAALRLDKEIAGSVPAAVVPGVGALALALGAGRDGPVARLAVIRSVGGAWQSLAGGTIDHRIVLDSRLGGAEEGGPVLAADGAIFGIATRGARWQSLVIPVATIKRVVPLLLERGSVARGWLGVALHPVALPDSLRPQPVQRVGLMVMDVVADGPAAQAGILAGDIVLLAGGAAATHAGRIARQLGTESVGKKLGFTIARAGTILRSEVTVGTAPP